MIEHWLALLAHLGLTIRVTETGPKNASGTVELGRRHQILLIDELNSIEIRHDRAKIAVILLRSDRVRLIT